MSKAPAFQFYPRDWLSSTSVRLMTFEERGILLELLCYSCRDEVSDLSVTAGRGRADRGHRRGL